MIGSLPPVLWDCTNRILCVLGIYRSDSVQACDWQVMEHGIHLVWRIYKSAPKLDHSIYASPNNWPKDPAIQQETLVDQM